MKILFMGTPDFSVPVLKALYEAGHEITAVVTQPDRPKGRGKEVQMSPVKQQALEYGIPVLQPKKIREPEAIEELKKYPADVAVVVAFGQILPKEVLELPVHGSINIHASLLPMYRGAAPIQRVILDGCRETGVTTMQMDEGLDTGDMLMVRKVPITDTETGGSLHDKLSTAGAELILETLEALEKGELHPVKQTGETCYAGMLTKSMGEIDWTRPADEIDRLIRGLAPWPSAYTYRSGKMLKIWEAVPVAEKTEAKPGTVVKVVKDAIYVAAGEGQICLKEIQAEGKKKMPAEAYLRGYKVEPGEVLGREKQE